MPLRDHIPPSWRDALADELEQPYWAELEAFVDAERSAHPGAIYPPPERTFEALRRVSFDQVRAVILGQDPYHGPGQAHGLSFSVPAGVALPPSLRNIFRELASDLGIEAPRQGDLSSWADQGVLLLNTVLTVRRGEAFSHRKKGWERFTDAIIARLGARREPLAFILWGAAAQKKKKLIDTDRHAVIASAHPSPLAARRGFFGSRPFSAVNDALRGWGREPIEWALPR